MDAKLHASYYSLVRHRDLPTSGQGFGIIKERDVFDSISAPEIVTWFKSLLKIEENDSSRSGGWLVKKTDDGPLMIFDMPGVSKENVTVFVEKNKTLIIKGVADKDSPEDDDASVMSYLAMFEFPENKFKLREIKAKMKNGLLKVKIPEMKLEKSTDGDFAF